MTDLLRVIATWVPAWNLLALRSTCRRWRSILPRSGILDVGGMYMPVIEGAHLNLARWIRATGCPWGAATTAIMARIGSIEMLEWAVECPISDNAYGEALRHNRDAVLDWLRGHNVPITHPIMLLGDLVRNDNLRGIEWLCALGPSYSRLLHVDAVMIEAADAGHTHIMDHIHDRVPPEEMPSFRERLDCMVREAAYRGGHLPVVIWVLAHGSGRGPEEPDWYAACLSDSTALFDWMVACGCHPPADLMSRCATYGRLACTQWLYARGHPILPEYGVMYAMCRRGAIDGIRWLQSVGLWQNVGEEVSLMRCGVNEQMLNFLHDEVGLRADPRDIRCVQEASTLRWLHDRGYEIPDDMMGCVIAEGADSDCIRLLRSWGRAWAPDALIPMMARGEYNTVTLVIGMGCPWPQYDHVVRVSGVMAKIMREAGCPYVLRDEHDRHIIKAEWVADS